MTAHHNQISFHRVFTFRPAFRDWSADLAVHALFSLPPTNIQLVHARLIHHRPFLYGQYQKPLPTSIDLQPPNRYRRAIHSLRWWPSSPDQSCGRRPLDSSIGPSIPWEGSRYRKLINASERWYPPRFTGRSCDPSSENWSVALLYGALCLSVCLKDLRQI